MHITKINREELGVFVSINIIHAKMEIKFVEICEEREIFKLITKYNNSFTPRLSDIRNDFYELAAKMKKNAVTIMGVSNKDLTAVGYISFYANDTVMKKAFISQVAVDDMYRNHGIGGQLVEECMSYCRRSGMKSIELEVHKANISVVEFYKRLGFRIIKNEDIENTNSIYMYKIL